MNKDNLSNAIEAAFAADRYALGAHWIYDGKELGTLTINWNELNAPQAKANWHKTKQCGDSTHYGDHGGWLLEFVNSQGKFSIAGYRDFWVEKMSSFEGYIDASTKETLEIIANDPEAVTGSNSDELSIIGRIAPLLLVSSSADVFLNNVQSFVGLTHNSSKVRSAAALFATILMKTLDGESIEDTLESIDINLILKDAFIAGRQSKGQDSFRTIRKFGPACGIEGAFEGVIHILSSYDNYKDAIIANVKAGGDSASRGMVIGMIMGAAGKEIPDAWAPNLISAATQ